MNIDVNKVKAKLQSIVDFPDTVNEYNIANDSLNTIKYLEAEIDKLKTEIEREEKLMDSWGIDGLTTITATNQALREENERLKAEVKRLENNEEFLANEQVKILDERDNLRKETAKMKCLALHGMFGYACAKMNVLVEKPDYKYGSGKIHKDFSRWHRLCRLWLKAHRKAKAELKEK